MAKSRDAFRTISEVADWLDTPAHVLRFWESKFSQIKPVKRAGGRRYYRPQDMALLGGIKHLLHEQGMTIKGAQKLLREKGIKHVSALGIQPGEDADAGDLLELKAVPIEEVTGPEPDTVEPETPEPEQPASDDPWPADPWTPEATPDQVAAARAAEAAEKAEAEAAARAEAEAARQAEADRAAAQAKADAEDKAAAARTEERDQRSRGIPSLPDPAAAQARPGILSIALTASPRRIAKNRERILPLVDRLHATHRRMGTG